MHESYSLFCMADDAEGRVRCVILRLVGDTKGWTRCACLLCQMRIRIPPNREGAAGMPVCIPAAPSSLRFQRLLAYSQPSHTSGL